MSCLRATKPLFTEDIHQVKRPIQDRLKKVYTLSLSLSLNERHRDCLYEGSTQYGGKWLACHFLGQSVHDIGRVCPSQQYIL